MEQPPGGRARGKARGRGRSQAAQQAGQQSVAHRRPGETPSHQVQQAEPGPGAASTRAHHHPSAPRGDASAGAITQQLSAMNVSSVGDSNEAQASSTGGPAQVGRGGTRGRREPHQERTIDVTRPQHIVTKQGTGGRPIDLYCNYFSMVDRTSWSIKQYRVDFDPCEDNTRMRKKLLRVHQAVLGQHYIFDGTMLFLEHALPDKEVEYLTKRETDDVQVRVLVKFVREVPPADYSFLHIFNIITNQCMTYIGLQKLKKMDREYFDVQAAQRVNQNNLEVWPGIRCAVGQHESSVLMCAAMSHKVLRVDTVFNQLQTMLQGRDGVGQCERMLLGAIVMCRHNLKTYKIDDIEWKKTPRDTFDYKGRQISFIDYYKEKYNLDVTTEQPLLVSRPKKREMRAGQDQPFILVPELCFMTGLSDDMRNDFRLMKELSGFLNMGPDQRVRKLRAFSQRLHQSQDATNLLKFWGLNFAKDLLQIKGREMAPEKIKTKVLSEARDGSWNDAIKTGVSSVVHLKRWFCFYSSRSREEAVTCVNNVIRVAKGFGMTIEEPKTVCVPDDRVNSFVQTVSQGIVPGTQLVMCIIPTKDKTKYDALKQLLCLTKPVPSQVVTGNLIRKNQRNLLGIATKIAIQLNCKLGGVPWEVNIPLKGTMIVGYDTYHESQRRDASAGAWVASMNDSATSYFSCATIHSNREEICSHMEINMNKSLEAYKTKNGFYPASVFVYRDGVGEGQIRYVKEMEVERLRAALQAKTKESKLVFIIVTKNINTRFFRAGGRIDNPPPGTVVDDVVTLPQRYDFYLVSQKTRIGTVAPTMYNVIHDESTLKPQHLQMLTYKLAHLYYNLSSTVRVPAPCHYAHRLAFLVGQSLHQEPAAELSNELFFL